MKPKKWKIRKTSSGLYIVSGPGNQRYTLAPMEFVLGAADYNKVVDSFPAYILKG